MAGSFPRANRDRKALLTDLKACLFGPGSSAAVARGGGKGATPQRQPSFLKRLSDFQLLVFLSRQVGLGPRGAVRCTPSSVHDFVFPLAFLQEVAYQ